MLSQEMGCVLFQSIDKGKAEIVPILNGDEIFLDDSVGLLEGDCVDDVFASEVYPSCILFFLDLVEHAVTVLEGREAVAQQFGNYSAYIGTALLFRYFSLPMASSSA